MRLGHRKELHRIVTDDCTELQDAFFSIGDLLEEIEPLHKAGKDQKACDLINACEQFVDNGTIVMFDLNRDTLHLSLYERESEWGGNPLALWAPAACTAVRCEHSFRLLQIREWDLINSENLLGQVDHVYAPEELRGSHG